MTALSDLNTEQQDRVISAMVRSWGALGGQNNARAFGVTAGGRQYCTLDGVTEATTAPDNDRDRLWTHAQHVVSAHNVDMLAGLTSNATTAATGA